MYPGQNAQAADLPAKQPWGEIKSLPQALELLVAKVPDDRTIFFPRLNNRIKQVYIKGSTAEKSNLKFQPEIETWKLTLPGDFTAGSSVVVEMMEPICYASGIYLVEPTSDGTIVLPAHHAVTHGSLLRYEPQPHKNTIGYWANEKDWAQWKMHVNAPGEYDIEVLQGCGKGQGGSTVSIEIADQKQEFTVEDTGHFQNFQPRQVGSVRIEKAGDYEVDVRAIKKAKGAVCDIQQIRLIPKKE
jgi:hypothetical protein